MFAQAQTAAARSCASKLARDTRLRQFWHKALSNEEKGLEAAKNEEMQIKELKEGLDTANAENALLRELLQKNGIDFSI